MKHHTDDTPEVSLTISTQSFFKVAFLIVGTILVLIALYDASHALLLLFAAFFLTLALNAPVSWVGRHLPGKFRGSRSFATSLSFLIVIAILGAFIASVVPPLVKQTDNLVHAAPHLVQQVRNQNGAVGTFIRKYHLQKQVNNFSGQLSDRLKNVGGTAFSTAQKVGSSAFSLVTILVFTFMMLVEGPRWIRFGQSLVPRNKKAMSERLTHDMYRVVKGYVNGQVILAALASLLISPMLFILHISYAVALIAVIFICGLIPMVGHTIGAVIVTSVALFHSLPAAIIILAYYIIYQQVENILIQPRIQANSTNMSPLLVFASVIIGVNFGGLFGGLVAIPVAGCLRVIVLEYLQGQNLLSRPKLDEALDERH
jgi:predicted PurR-regulated permease PerM